MRKSVILAAAALIALTSCSKSVRIVQYNVGVFSKAIENSIPMVSAMMKELGADAVSLNELDSCNLRHNTYQLADFASAMGGWDYRYSHSIDFGNGAYGVGIVTEDKILDSFTFILDQGDGAEQRSCCVVETKDYVLASTHLDHCSGAARLAGARKITATLTERYGNTRKPVFLAGDMNADPESATISEYKKNWTLLSTTELTAPADSPEVCIDYIFLLNNGAKCKVLGSCVPTEFKEGDVKVASDHLPVYVDVKI